MLTGAVSPLPHCSREVVQSLIDEYKACESPDYPNIIPGSAAL